jgi:TonB family protein
MQPCFSRVASIALAAACLAVPVWLGDTAHAQDALTRAQLLAQGEQLLSQQQYRRAVAAFEEAGRLSDTGCVECFLGLSRTYVAWGKAGKAIETARQALQLNPPKPLLARANHQLGIALLAQTNHGAGVTGIAADTATEAEGVFRKALDNAPTDWNVDRFNLAGLLFQTGHADEAVALAREYLKNAPTGSAATDTRMLICLARKGAAAPATSADAPPEPGAEVEPPRPLYRQPPNTSRKKLQGSVLVQVSIDRDGCAVNPTLSGGMGNELDGAAVDAVRHWVFQPAMSQGKAVPSDSIVSVNFTKTGEEIKDADKAFREKVFAAWPAPQ